VIGVGVICVGVIGGAVIGGGAPDRIRLLFLSCGAEQKGEPQAILGRSRSTPTRSSIFARQIDPCELCTGCDNLR
jgi:hypothetical protein